MNKELKRILEDKLEALTVSNVISAEEVLSLESMVDDLAGNEGYKSFITKDIPIHKFTMRPSATNLEPVKVKITSILSSFRDTETKINGNSARIFRNNLWSLEALFGNAMFIADAVANIPEEVISLLRNFKYTTVSGDLFIEHGDEVEFVKAVFETNLKDLFFQGGVIPEYMIHPVDNINNPVNEITYTLNDQVYGVNCNDASWGLVNHILTILENNPEAKIEPVELIKNFLTTESGIPLTRGYTITIKDLVAFSNNADKVREILEGVVNLLKGAQGAFYSSDYLKVLISTQDEDKYKLNPELCPVREIIQALKDCPTYPELGDNVDISFDIIRNMPKA